MCVCVQIINLRFYYPQDKKSYKPRGSYAFILEKGAAANSMKMLIDNIYLISGQYI